MQPTIELPDDPALPGLVAIRAAGVARAIPALDLHDGSFELLLHGYTPGERATLELRAGHRRLAIKTYAEDPTPEAELYQALAAAGLAGTSGVRVPPLVAWERELRMLVIGWLDGRPANRLVREGQGERAGELAAAWIQRAASLPLWLGPPCGAGYALYQAGRSVAALGAADAALGSAARALAGKLARAQPRDEAPRLVHGTLYDRHLLDLGDGPGVIDWQRAGQGPLELDAGMFLATVWRLGLRDPAAAPEAARAEQAFLAGTAGLIDERALAWHRAAALLRLAGRIYVVSRRKADWLTRADALLSEAARVAERVAPSGRVARAEPAAAPARFALKISALELVLQALSARPATAGELDQIRRLLAEMSAEKGSR